MPTKIFILVFKGDPVDLKKFRHTALYLEFAAGTHSMMHVTGTQGMFVFEAKTDYNPVLSRSLVKMIPAAEVPDSISEASIKSTVSATPAKNSREDLDWNCQLWVGDALTRLTDRDYVSKEQRDAAIDAMVDACMEAEDE
ncbi:conserved hypothetical protein [Histoplasma capsulatum H143]|uniref:Uncharacterized protein n=1 Tax=Ajellomyces capsulatus (strain H143) TaxID=544712 RepID=C6HJA8_AJECH|nr:conserved hypothetical protein [Histoplasma capsulatum H143]